MTRTMECGIRGAFELDLETLSEHLGSPQTDQRLEIHGSLERFQQVNLVLVEGDSNPSERSAILRSFVDGIQPPAVHTAVDQRGAPGDFSSSLLVLHDRIRVHIPDENHGDAPVERLQKGDGASVRGKWRTEKGQVSGKVRSLQPPLYGRVLGANHE